VADRADQALQRLLTEDPRQGWTMFVDAYTPTLLSLIERSGVAERDEVLDVYVRVCERLAANDCARLRRYDARRGALAAWLTLVVRHAVVDWVRSRKGRRRFFNGIRRLDRFDRQVFELYYWRQLRPADVAQSLHRTLGRAVSLDEVLTALDRVHGALTDRNRAQLASLLVRTRRVEPLDAGDDRPSLQPADTGDDPEKALQARESEAAWTDALRDLSREEAVIVRMLFVHGWARHEVQRALHLRELTSARIQGILAKLREALVRRGIGPRDAGTSRMRFLEGR
jgi:RNA polymerase sigma factor (sigma-70 family)